MIYDKRSFENMKYIEDALQSPITGIKTDDFDQMEKVIVYPSDVENNADKQCRH